MKPRFVCKDTNNGKGTVENPVNVKPSLRMVVPGYGDSGVLEIRRDSQTACRESITGC